MTAPLPEKGTRLRLIAMPEDPDPITPGTLGTVQGGSPAMGASMPAQIWMRWDDGRSLNLIVGLDEWEVVS